jgi:hypothetical protein
MLAPVLMGKYGIEDDALYLMPMNFYPLLKLVKIDAAHAMSVLKLIIAHELTHAIQDQEIDLGKMSRTRGGLEEMQAFNATIEGHAVFVQERVGHSLGLEDVVLESARLFAAGAVELHDPGVEMIAKMIGAQFEQVYLGGRGFIQYHHEKGGMRRVWEILANPPVETSMIARPDTYSPRAKAELDYASILNGVERDFGERKWTVKNVKVGQMLMRSAYANVEPTAREEIMANVSRAQTLVVQCAQPVSMADITIIVLDDPGFAPKFVAILEETARKNVAKMKTGAVLKVAGLEIGRFPKAPPDATAASKVSFAVTLPTGGVQRHVFVRICRGDLLVEIHEFGVGLTDDKFAAIAQRVFARYQEAKEAQAAFR